MIVAGGEGWTVRLIPLPIAAALLVAPGEPAAAQRRGPHVRYELARVTVTFDEGAMSSARMEAFARLVDDGIRDIQSHLRRNAPEIQVSDERLTYHVSRRVWISRTYRDTVLLPLRRVREQRAPYLHEAAHALVPSRNREIWLNEGFASYIESYVAENVGGYAGHVFSSAGNAGIDGDARLHLRGAHGRRALEYLGRRGAPEGFYRDRERVAAPLYVLSHSFFKYLVENAGLARAAGLLESGDSARGLETGTGRTLESWKSEWLTAIRAD